MIYPDNFEFKIGFDSIRKLLSEACISDLGKEYVNKIRLTTNILLLKRLHKQVTEFRHILNFGKPFPVSGYFDLRYELNRLKTEGTYISAEELFNLKSSLETISNIISFFKKTETEQYEELKKLMTDFEFPQEILTKAKTIIDEKGNIKDTASGELVSIRAKIAGKQRQIIAETRKAFSKAKQNGYLPEGSEITIRNGRAVIPVKASDKRAIKGFIHDESSSGQTVFIEPITSFEINNEIIELENKERREIIKILTNFSNVLRPEIYNLLNAYRFLGIIDFIRAKAVVASSLNASSPTIDRNGEAVLTKAYHPLLMISHKKINKEVVPVDISLNKANRILIISGPNAGGKSVCMKTFGLLQYMFQCGLQIPASPDSRLPVFENIFLDIGDEQSLENDLSTYSSHLLNMKFFLKNANSKTLFLIDEFGTGTEPHLGAAIAEATLEQLAHKKAYGIITTHYTNIKLAADRIKGLINGAMLFDTEKMQPLYILKTGKPGSSFAFEIANKIGFPEDVLNRAKKKSGGKHLVFDKQLQQLETDKLSMEEKQKYIERKESEILNLENKYKELLSKLEKEKKEIIKKAKIEALEIIEKSNKEIEKTIKEIKEAKADKNKTKTARNELEKKKSKLQSEVSKEKKIKKNTEIKRDVENKKIKEGDFVEIKGMDVVGEVIRIENKDVSVNVNNVILNTSLDKLVKTDKKPKNAVKKISKNNIINEINEKAANFELTLDLRGKRGEEALEILARYIDDAILLNIKEISILHGKGYGILRELIRDFLKNIKEIKWFGDAHIERGGAGITRVVFK
jgi:DNA mismatch repair protein MutS2